MIRENRIKYYAAADYRDDSDLDRLVKLIIRKTAEDEKLEDWYNRNVEEAGYEKIIEKNQEDKKNTKAEKAD